MNAVQCQRHGRTGGGGRVSPFLTEVNFLSCPNPVRREGGGVQISRMNFLDLKTWFKPSSLLKLHSCSSVEISISLALSTTAIIHRVMSNTGC